MDNRREPWDSATPPRRRKRGFGVFMLVSLILIAGLAVTLVTLASSLDLRLTRSEYGFGFSRGGETYPPATDAPAYPAPDEPSEPYEPAEPTSTPAPNRAPLGIGGGDASVVIVDIPRAEPTPEPAPVPGERPVLTLPEIYERVAPSVVGILSEGEYSSGTGTGIIMTEDGYIITNNHVVIGASVITVILEDGSEYDAALIGRDDQTDLAVLKIDAEGLPPVEFGNSDNMRPGDMAAAIGNPTGMSLQNTITEGIISAINRDMTIDNHKMTLLQISASVNPGNSGGPLINEYGQVIGVISSKVMGGYFSQSLEGLGFAIPIHSAAPILDELIRVGYIQGRATIGITNAAEVGEQNSRFFDYPPGVLVLGINPDCDAARQGVAVGDIITHAEGEPVYTLAEINEIKNNLGAGSQMTLTVFREGDTIDITFTLMDQAELQ